MSRIFFRAFDSMRGRAFFFLQSHGSSRDDPRSGYKFLFIAFELRRKKVSSLAGRSLFKFCAAPLFLFRNENSKREKFVSFFVERASRERTIGRIRKLYSYKTWMYGAENNISDKIENIKCNFSLFADRPACVNDPYYGFHSMQNPQQLIWP